jgi:hypothetical protein
MPLSSILAKFAGILASFGILRPPVSMSGALSLFAGSYAIESKVGEAPGAREEDSNAGRI